MEGCRHQLHVWNGTSVGTLCEHDAGDWLSMIAAHVISSGNRSVLIVETLIRPFCFTKYEDMLNLIRPPDSQSSAVSYRGGLVTLYGMGTRANHDSGTLVRDTFDHAGLERRGIEVQDPVAERGEWRRGEGTARSPFI